MCDDTNQAIGVSLVFAAWNSAIVLGPALGGTIPTFEKKIIFRQSNIPVTEVNA